MKNKWLNLVLLLTNRIYSRKQNILQQTGIKIVINILSLILLETFLAIISLPLYLSVKSSKVVAYLEERGKYVKVAFDYNVRRVLTLTAVSLFLLIWAIKFVLIMAVPSVYGPLELYSISDLRPVDISREDLIVVGTQIETSKIVSTMVVPKLEEVKKIRGQDYRFSGVGKPLSTVVLLFSDKQTIIYSEGVDEDGRWQINHSQEDFKLSQGNHSVIAFTYDENLGARSNLSAEQFFKVQTSWVDKLVSNVDILANWSVIILIAIGVFLTILTI